MNLMTTERRPLSLKNEFCIFYQFKSFVKILSKLLLQKRKTSTEPLKISTCHLNFDIYAKPKVIERSFIFYYIGDNFVSWV